MGDMSDFINDQQDPFDDNACPTCGGEGICAHGCPEDFEGDEDYDLGEDE